MTGRLRHPARTNKARASPLDRREFARAMETNKSVQGDAPAVSLYSASTSTAGQSKDGKASGVARRGSDRLDQVISEMPAGGDVRLQEIAPFGALIARKWKNGIVKFFWRTTFNKQLFREEIGIYNPSANRKRSVPDESGRYCVNAAIAAANKLSVDHESAREDGGLRGKREKDLAASAEQQRLEEANRLALELEHLAREKQSLQVLLEHYWRKLEARKASSAVEVRNSLKRHVTESKLATVQEIAKKPARDITRDDVVAVLAPIYGGNHGRQANKIRSYLHSAYEMAIDAAGNAATANSVREFDLQWNPVSKTARNRQFNRADKRPLSIEEMREYWQVIQDVPGTTGAALRLHLLLGAPRIQQLIRTTTGSLGSDAIMLIDTKGRSAAPRAYELPLQDVLLREIRLLKVNKPHLFSTDGGATPIFNTTLSGWAKDLVGDRIAGFQMKRVRSGVETMLAALGFANDVRGKLQSHGGGGVQDVHYNDHDYYFEKRDALEALYVGLTSEVAPVRQRARSKVRKGLLALDEGS